MAENYKSNSKSKSYRSNRDETRRINVRRKFEESKHYSFESKTPPLPTNSNSIEDLLKQKSTLEDELKNLAKHADGNFKSQYKSTSNEIKKRKNCSISAYDVPSKNTHAYQRKIWGNNKHNRLKEMSPEYIEDNVQLESEDEEDIIEKRRKLRKQLLEKFNTSDEKGCDSNNFNEENSKVNSFENNDKKKYAMACRNPIIKEENDMFSEKEFISTNVPNNVSNADDNNTQLTDNWDDSEGYYHIREGDVINSSRYTIIGILGQGVFATVVRAQDNNQGNSIAIKIVRNNELMYKTGLKEASVLKEISDADPDGKFHCVKFMSHFMHKGHLCLVLESLHMDLRCVIKKYGKHGLNMKALMSYSRQLLIALRLLKKIGIIHSDIKPDNILVNEKKNILKLCDFGSATKVNDVEPTPYLVSRFYRAPEIILGIPYEHGVDVWSTACTIFEMATGKILFTGSSNNKMLKCFMDLKGRISSKLIRKGKFKDQHFNYNNNFLLHKKDEFTGRDKVVEISNIKITRDLGKDLKKNCKTISTGEEKKLIQLKDLLDKMVILDPSQRILINDCLKHSFIQEEFQSKHTME